MSDPGTAPKRAEARLTNPNSGTVPSTGAALVPYDAERHRRDEAAVRSGFWAKARLVLGRVPFLDEATAAYYCATDPGTPLRVKALLMAALAYFILPADIIPDFIAGLGFTDDATVLFTTISLVSGHVKGRHRHRARRALVQLGFKDGSFKDGGPRDSGPRDGGPRDGGPRDGGLKESTP
ncbi:YkvA family protein [Pelagibius sp.]|uniref:YkvA family protein n=1 Tax=Pelagibius sp. TaxID=1931238 RepID=UPI00262DE772|nr:YkvA family protein [Pelagibius sp.]